MVVQVPDGVQEGMTMQVMDPASGQPFQVQVPAGVGPGGQFQVRIPPACVCVPEAIPPAGVDP